MTEVNFFFQETWSRLRVALVGVECVQSNASSPTRLEILTPFLFYLLTMKYIPWTPSSLDVAKRRILEESDNHW